MIDDKRLDEIEARTKAATRGPWACFDAFEWDGRTIVPRLGNHYGDQVLGTNGHPKQDLMAREEDFAFIAHAREDVPELVAEVRRLRTVLHHTAWVGYQIAAGQPYNLVPTEAQLASLRDAAARFAEDPDMTPERNHENWMRYKLANGWRYGPTKDEAAKTHPDLVPFRELPEVEKRKDVMDLEALRLGAGLGGGCAQREKGITL